MEREDIMKFFRDDERLNELSIDDRYEISLACLAFNDRLCRLLEIAYDLAEED